jgi:hypothetical protein
MPLYKVNSRGNEYFPAMLLELVSKYQRQQHTEIVDTILNNMSKTLKAQSPSTVVTLCHRSVKSAMIKADEEDYKEQKEVFGKFIEENKFYMFYILSAFFYQSAEKRFVI